MLRILIILAILGLAVILLVGYIARLQQKSREIDKRIDYSNMKEWKDDD